MFRTVPSCSHCPHYLQLMHIPYSALSSFLLNTHIHANKSANKTHKNLPPLATHPSAHSCTRAFTLPIGISAPRHFRSSLTFPHYSCATGSSSLTMSKPTAALAKWWKAYTPVRGQRVQTLSPFQQDHLTPFFRSAPDALKHKIVDNFWDVVPAFALGAAVVWWSDSTYEAEIKKHRS